MIELRDLSFSYKGNNALKNINIEIKRGDSIAVIGPNGSGKSTLLRVISGIIYPTQGEYLFNGEKITEKKMQSGSFSKAFHKRVGFVFQNSETQLFCTSVIEEVAFAPIQMGLPKDEIEKRSLDCLKLLGIENLKDRAPYNLSGGEKKKVAIASVLSHNPDVLVLDEPMNGLDPKTKKFLKNLLIKLNISGKTIICATHDFDYVEDVFKRAVVFSEEHRIIRDGDYKEIISDREFLEENNII